MVTGLLALTALAIAAWPASPRHRAHAVVHVGVGRQQPTTIRFDQTNVVRASGVTELIGAITTHPRLDVDLEATARSAGVARQRVRDAAEFVRVTAAAVVPTTGQQAQARADAIAAQRALDSERARLQDAQNALAQWRAAKGNADPAQQLTAVQGQLAAAVRARDQAQIAQLQQQQYELASAETTYSDLKAAVAAAQNGVTRATRANDDARFRTGATPVMERAAITVGPVSTQAFDTERPFGRAAIAAMLLILVIIAADVLFLTRTRLVSPYARETTRDRRARRSAERRERADERAIERARRKPKPAPQPRARRPRVAAKPLDLPNIEVHLMDKEGGLRAVELRDAAHEPEERQGAE